MNGLDCPENVIGCYFVSSLLTWRWSWPRRGQLDRYGLIGRWGWGHLL